MPTDVHTETVEPSRKRKRSSTAAKLIQAAALAAVLVPLGSIAMEGASITCGYSGASNPSGCAGDGTTRTFNFDLTSSAEDDYKVILEFFDMSNPFQMTVTDHQLSHAAFLAREGLPGTYDCVDMVDPGDFANPCREFEFESSSGVQWDSFHVDIVWDYDSEGAAYPNGTDPAGATPGQVRLLQNKGAPPDALVPGSFTIDMCLEAAGGNEDFDPCDYEASAIDPRIGGGNTDFSTITVGFQPVPEPSSLILLASGVSAALYRRRRKRQAV